MALKIKILKWASFLIYASKPVSTLLIIPLKLITELPGKLNIKFLNAWNNNSSSSFIMDIVWTEPQTADMERKEYSLMAAIHGTKY